MSTLPQNVLRRAVFTATEIYNARGVDGPFDFRDITPDVVAAINRNPELLAGAVLGLATYAVGRADDNATASRVDEQPSLPGVDWEEFTSETSYWKLGDRQRVRKDLATIEHLDLVLANDEENVGRILAASSKKHKFVAAIREILSHRVGMTVREAIAIYREEHPGGAAGPPG